MVSKKYTQFLLDTATFLPEGWNPTQLTIGSGLKLSIGMLLFFFISKACGFELFVTLTLKFVP
jgi:hypothetical protein